MKKKIQLPTLKLESSFWKEHLLVAGVDEAGRGCLAGPVVAGAVIINDRKLARAGIRDSKELTHESRLEIFEAIKEKSFAYSTGIVDNKEIDRINILQASMKAMRMAIHKLDPLPGQLLIDGNYFIDFGIPYRTIIKGDSGCLSIAAASITAKVSRDLWMIEKAHKEFPDYGFKAHKGYATRMHVEAIRQYGTCSLHRLSFLSKYNNGDRTLFDDDTE
ncbi:MAG: ribonuclease HII [Bacteroidota bacterium]